jgi:DnaK suppressor protein
MAIETERFKKKLLAERDTLEKELATIGRQNPEHPSDWEPTPKDREDTPVSRDEVADKIESFEENIALARHLESRLAEVRDALARIEENVYGVCRVCKKEIEEERLLANPAATTCKMHLK